MNQISPKQADVMNETFIKNMGMVGTTIRPAKTIKDEAQQAQRINTEQQVLTSLLVTMVQYLSRIDSSFKVQIKTQRWLYTDNQRQQRETYIESGAIAPDAIPVAANDNQSAAAESESTSSLAGMTMALVIGGVAAIYGAYKLFMNSVEGVLSPFTDMEPVNQDAKSAPQEPAPLKPPGGLTPVKSAPPKKPETKTAPGKGGPTSSPTTAQPTPGASDALPVGTPSPATPTPPAAPPPATPVTPTPPATTPPAPAEPVSKPPVSPGTKPAEQGNKSDGYVNPIDGYKINSGYGTRKDPFTGAPTFHTGVDIAAPPGTPVKAIKAGTVTRISRNQKPYTGFGNVVIVDHGDGYQAVYAHLSKFACKAGDTVQQGQIIGYVGSTGGRTTGNHLHLILQKTGFAIPTKGNTINPAPLIRKGGATVPAAMEGYDSSAGNSDSTLEEMGNRLQSAMTAIAPTNIMTRKLRAQAIERDRDLTRPASVPAVSQQGAPPTVVMPAPPKIQEVSQAGVAEAALAEFAFMFDIGDQYKSPTVKGLTTA